MQAKDLKPGQIFRTDEKIYFVNRQKWEKPGATDLRCTGEIVNKENREKFIKALLHHLGAVEVHVPMDAKVRKV